MSLSLYCLLFHSFLSIGARDLMDTSNLWPIVSHSLHITWLFSFVAGESFSWWLSKVLIYEYHIISLGPILLLHSFSNVGIYPRSMGYLVLGSRPTKQHWEWVPFHKMSTKSNRILVVYSQKILTTLTPTYVADRSPLEIRECNWVGVYVILWQCTDYLSAPWTLVWGGEGSM